MENVSFREKIQQLEKELAKNAKSLEDTVAPASSGMSWLTISAITAPIVVFLSLYLFSPKFVCLPASKNSKKSVRSTKRVFLFSLGVSILIWMSLYGYSQYSMKA